MNGFSQSTKSEISSLRQDYGYMISRIEQAEKNIVELNNSIKVYQIKIDSLILINYKLLIELQAKISSENKNLQIDASQTANNKIEAGTNIEKQPISFGRCKATTQKGSQCSRSAGSSGFCWQHNK
jgi:hypothetical protein